MSDDELPPLIENNIIMKMSNTDECYEDDSDPDNWSDEEGESESVTCLFCEKISQSTNQGIEHLKTEHQIDLSELKSKFNMDQYSYIKMINCIRANKIEAKVLQFAVKPFWDDDKYLKPSDFEYWLTFDFDNMPEKQVENDLIDRNASDLKVAIELSRKLQQELDEKSSLLDQANELLVKMRSTMQIKFNECVEQEENITGCSSKSNPIDKNIVASLSLKSDEGYFSSYSHYGIHHEMLSDRIRTESYRNAFFMNADFIKDKSVLDVGCGTSILSMFATQTGAKDVIAIDNSDIIYKAMDIARKNNFPNIKFVKGRLEDTELPLDKFDIIVSEWMGYFLLFEGMLDSVIYARDRHLKLGGTLMPSRCNISLIGYSDTAKHKEFIQFWNNVYGYDMHCMQTEVLHEASIEICNSKYILTTSEIIADYDLMKVDTNYSNFTYNFRLKVLHDGELTSFVGYFDTFFDLPSAVQFSTSPANAPTHWKQVVFYLEHPVPVKVDEEIVGKIFCNRSRKDLRSLTIRIEVFGKDLHFSMD